MKPSNDNGMMLRGEAKPRPVKDSSERLFTYG
jgi:hypothetical protein